MPLTNAFHAYKWSALGEAASRAIGPLVFLVLARLLVPADFGVVAAATVLISFSQIFADAGLGKALIQRQGDTDECANGVFWVNLAVALMIALALCAFAPRIAGFFHDVRIASVVRVLSLQVVLAAVASVHTALMQKRLEFRRLFWVRLLSASFTALVSIPLALLGWGYWALVAGTLAGQAIQTTSLLLLSPWRPRAGLDWKLTRALLRFGKWALLSSLLAWFYAWMDALVVGHYLGSHDMGLYRTGNSLATMIFGLIFTPLLPVLYALFSRAQRDIPSIRKSIPFVARTMALIGLPIGFLMLAVSDRASELLFGAEWIGVGPVIGIMGVMHAISWIVGANGEAYRAIGKPHVETWVGLGLLGAYLVVYLISVRYGLHAFLLARLGLAIVALVAHIFVARLVLEIRLAQWNFLGIAIFSGAAALLVSAADSMYAPSMAVLVAITASTWCGLMGVLYLLERGFLGGLVKTITGEAR